MTVEIGIQQPFDAAVVIVTLLRPSLPQAVRSVYAQQGAGRVQVVLAVDGRADTSGMLPMLRAECPSHMHLTVIDTGYSLSVRNGSLYPTRSGGSLRTAASYLANSRHVAYLDDDNWWAPDHLEGLLAAIPQKSFAFSLRKFVDDKTDTVLCNDDWASVGPGRGIYNMRFGGFVDPGCLMVDKLACHEALPAWSMARFIAGSGDDRMLFERIKNLPCGASGRYSAFYRVRLDELEPQELWKLKQAGVDLSGLLPADKLPSTEEFAQLERKEREFEEAQALLRKPAGHGTQGAPAVRLTSAQFTLKIPTR